MDSKAEHTAKESLLTLALEAWRFSNVFCRVIGKIDAGEQARYVSQYRYFLKQMEDILLCEGYKFVNLEGQLFDPGTAATALNLNDFAPDELLVIDQMLEPVVMSNEGLVRMGTVLLRKVEKR
jgi:hypothetical protein